MKPKEYTLKNGKKIIIRQAEPDDAEPLMRYCEELFRDDKFLLTTRQEIAEYLTVEKQKERIEKYSKTPGMIVLIAEDDSVIAGAADVDNGRKQRRKHVGRVGVSVLKEHRGIGCGKALLQSVIEWAQEDEIIEKLSLDVFADNTAAIGLYKKLGFRKEGIAIKELKINEDEYTDMILMYKFVK